MTGSAALTAGSDSPVSTASSHSSWLASNSRRSAGTTSPTRRRHHVAGHELAHVEALLARRRARPGPAWRMLACSAATASSERYSLTNPSPTLRTTIAAMIAAVGGVAGDGRRRPPRPSSRISSGLRSWRPRTPRAVTLWVASTLRPTVRSRLAASSERDDRPRCCPAPGAPRSPANGPRPQGPAPAASTMQATPAGRPRSWPAHGLNSPQPSGGRPDPGPPASPEHEPNAHAPTVTPTGGDVAHPPPAPTPPSTPNTTSAAPATARIRTGAGASTTASSGSTAPTAKLTADTTAACTGRAISSSLKPSSSVTAAPPARDVVVTEHRQPSVHLAALSPQRTRPPATGQGHGRWC